MTEDNEGKLLDQAALGSKASAELNVLGKAFAEVRNELSAAWASSGPKDNDAREKMWMAVSLLTRVENVLRGYVANGEFAKKQLEQIRNAGEPKRVFGLRL